MTTKFEIEMELARKEKKHTEGTQVSLYQEPGALWNKGGWTAWKASVVCVVDSGGAVVVRERQDAVSSDENSVIVIIIKRQVACKRRRLAESYDRRNTRPVHFDV